MLTFLVSPCLEYQLLTWGGQISLHCTWNILNNMMVFIAKPYHTQEGNDWGLQVATISHVGAYDGKKAFADEAH